MSVTYKGFILALEAVSTFNLLHFETCGSIIFSVADDWAGYHFEEITHRKSGTALKSPRSRGAQI